MKCCRYHLMTKGISGENFQLNSSSQDFSDDNNKRFGDEQWSREQLRHSTRLERKKVLFILIIHFTQAR